MSEVTIRPATRDDLPGIMDLWDDVRRLHLRLDADYYADTGASSARAEVSRWYAETLGGPDGFVLVAEEAGRVVGFLVAYLRRRPAFMRLGDFVMIDTVGIDEAHRRRGLFRRLLGALEAAVSERGVTMLQLHVDAGNSDACEAYRATGFSPRQAIWIKWLTPPAEPAGDR